MPIGSIKFPARYARAKMLEHKDWINVMARNSTPSDIDMVLSNGPFTCFCELSTQTPLWHYLDKGQLYLAESLVTAGKGKIWYCLLYHKPSPDIEIPINSYKDILDFSVMYWKEDHIEKKHMGKTGSNNGNWPIFAKWWIKYTDRHK